MPAGVTYLTLSLFVVGVALILRGFLGRPQWTQPTCAKCRYDLRGLNPDEHQECPECGANLTKVSAVRFGRARRSYKVMILGLLLAMSPLLFAAGRHVHATVANRLAQQRPNERLLADLAANINDPQTWNELLNRHYNNRLSDADIAAAIDHLIAHFEAAPAGAGGQRVHWASQFLSIVIAEERISSEQHERLCRAYYAGLPMARMPARVRSGDQINFDISGMGRDLDGVTTIIALREVTLNEKPISVRPWGAGTFRQAGDALSASGPWGVKGNLTIEAEPGEHELVFTIDFGVIEGFRGAFTPNAPPGPVEQWPPTIFRDVREVRAPFTVLAPGESPIALVTDPRLREQVIAALRITGLRFGYDHGMQTAELVFQVTRDIPVPLSFQMYVRAGDYERGIGSVTSHGGGMGRSGFRQQLRGFPDVETVTVIFRPDPAAVEGRAEWTEIWGEEIVIENVRVIRPASQREMDEQAMRAALHVHAVDPGWRQGRRTSGPTLHMNHGSAPLPARFRIYIRSGEYEHLIATMTLHEGGSRSRGGAPAVDLPEDVQTVTVVFRPDLDDLDDEQRKGYWSEEIFFENVPVIRNARRPRDESE